MSKAKINRSVISLTTVPAHLLSLSVLSLSLYAEQAQAACQNTNGFGATNSSVCSSAASYFSSSTTNAPARSNTATLTLSAADLTVEQLPATPDSNHNVVFGRTGILTIEGNLTAILNGAAGTSGGILLNATADSTLTINGNVILVSTLADAIGVYSRASDLLIKGNLQVLPSGPTGTSSLPAQAVETAIQATTGGHIEVQGNSVLNATNRAVAAVGLFPSTIKLGNLTSTSGGYGLYAENNTGSGIQVTGNQVNILVTGNDTQGVHARDGADIFIDPAGGTIGADDNSTIVFNNPNAACVPPAAAPAAC